MKATHLIVKFVNVPFHLNREKHPLFTPQHPLIALDHINVGWIQFDSVRWIGDDDGFSIEFYLSGSRIRSRWTFIDLILEGVIWLLF